MTLTSRQKKLFRCALFIFTLLLYIFPIFFKNPSLFFLFPVENLDNFGVFLFLYHFDAFFTFFKFFYLTIIYQKRASVPFIDGTLALLIIWRFRE